MKKIKRGDFIILLISSIAAGILLLFTFSSDWLRKITRAEEQDSLIAKIERDGSIAREIDLNAIEDVEYIRFDEGIKVTIEAKPGQIRFLDSECPDQICVKTGWLTRKGHIAVCMPARTIVSI